MSSKMLKFGLVITLVFVVFRWNPVVCPTHVTGRGIIEVHLELLINEHGGLPKESTYMTRIVAGKDTLYPVATWSLEEVEITNIPDVLDLDPRYILLGIVNVEFADGDTAKLRWSDIYSGFAVCNFLVIDWGEQRRPISLDIIEPY